jgi:hypothetical protein
VVAKVYYLVPLEYFSHMFWVQFNLWLVRRIFNNRIQQNTVFVRQVQDRSTHMTGRSARGKTVLPDHEKGDRGKAETGCQCRPAKDAQQEEEIGLVYRHPVKSEVHAHETVAGVHRPDVGQTG